ncbi:hypothetical protein PR202_ga10594 [Eleusine coracana subsp. coracana]|uniref:Hyaluronan/mRNA-binding protein domain-containing protein n=1 Tax=Eleusine coracana subsp. coracana TaxID=191504 RepID=A0AAV5C739_ELECO|nr:hypothetical protein PR202_ga10594 [Eleusine coracana subsp. coracana]
MGSKNQFDLLVDVESDDPLHLVAAAAKKAAASPKPAAAAPAAPAKLPTKPAPPAQAVKESRNYGATQYYDGAGRGRGGFRGGRTGARREFGEGDTNGVEGGYAGGSYGDGGFVRREDGEGKVSERGRGPRQPYRGGGRRGGYTDGEAGDESGRPRRAYERHSGTGRGYGMKREGAGRGNWGTVTDEALTQETVEVINIEGAAAVTEEENKLEEVPQPEVEKDKEGEPNEEEEDKEMTLEEYEKLLEEKRKALLALKTEERKVVVDKELQGMQPLSVKKGTDEVFIKLGSDKDKKKENAEKDERAKKCVSINEFLKPAEGERYYGPGRGRGRGRGRGDRGRLPGRLWRSRTGSTGNSRSSSISRTRREVSA